MSTRVEIRIDKEGKTHIEVFGMEGQGCEDITRLLQEALGGQVEDVQQKPEYFVELEGIEQEMYEE